MRLIRQHAFARSALVGNPSDGYHGKTISLIVPHFRAGVCLYEWDEMEVMPSQHDRSRFRSVAELVDDVSRHGYYGGIRLVKATIKRFIEFCRDQGLPLHNDNFSIRYESNIPRQVGLAGSSAIVAATIRALMEFYGLKDAIPREVLPSLALAVETDELNLPAGLQDRVIQTYEGLVYMDFSVETMRDICGYECGVYEEMDRALLPPLYLAYRPGAGKPLQARVCHDDRAVQEAMTELAELAGRARDAILEQDYEILADCMNGSFDIRQRVFDVRPDYVQMIRLARSAGASANFSGSGGAIVGAYENEQMFDRLSGLLEQAGCRVFKVNSIGEGDW